MNRLLLLCTVLIGLTYGYSRFRGEIPNGYNVKHPCPGGGVWDAVGHMSPGYTTRKNAFGQDVRNMLRGTSNFDWSQVCNVDSDGDGLTNGQELGDPSCRWRRGDPSPGPVLGHPGLCEPERQQCTSGFTFPDCPNRFASNAGAGPQKQLPIDANDHPQRFLAKTGRVGPSVMNMAGRQQMGMGGGQAFPGQWQQQQAGQMPSPGFQGGAGMAGGMTGTSIFGPSSSGLPSQFTDFGRGGGSAGSFFPDTGFQSMGRDTSSWQGGATAGMRSRGTGFTPSFTAQGPSSFGRFEDPRMSGSGMTGFGGGMTPTMAGSGGMSPAMTGGMGLPMAGGMSGGMTAGMGGGMAPGMGGGMTAGMGGGMRPGMTPGGSGPGAMFGPSGPPPFWMRGPFQRF